MISKKTVLITNGSGGCGKDTMAEIMNKYVSVQKVSSIDIFKEMLKPYTNDYITIYGKDEKYRKLLNTVKMAFVEFNELPLYTMLAEILNFSVSEDQDILLIDIREPEEIEKIVKKVTIQLQDTIDIKTILVINNNVPTIISNQADNAVFDYAPYDYVIDNSGTLEDLENSVILLLQELGFEVKDNE